MHITGGGLLILGIIGAVVFVIIIISRWRKTGSMSIPAVSLGGSGNRKDDTVLCLNVYKDSIKGEYMKKDAVAKGADIVEIGSKKYVFQGNFGTSDWRQLPIPDEVIYPTERLSRMMGCLPLRRFKASSEKWYEKLAPFAPVVALIFTILFFYLMAN